MERRRKMGESDRLNFAFTRERKINMDYSKLKYIRLFKDEYSEEKWKTICEVLDINDNEKIISVELGVAKITPQIH